MSAFAQQQGLQQSKVFSLGSSGQGLWCFQNSLTSLLNHLLMAAIVRERPTGEAIWKSSFLPQELGQILGTGEKQRSAHCYVAQHHLPGCSLVPRALSPQDVMEQATWNQKQTQL